MRRRLRRDRDRHPKLGRMLEPSPEELKFAQRVGVCHVCTGIKPCPVDGNDIREHAYSGKCPKGKFDGPPVSLTIGGVAHGAAGIAKAVLGVGGASPELIEQRTEICKGCEHAILSLGVLSRCKLCGCATWAKVRNANEKCPAGKW